MSEFPYTQYATSDGLSIAFQEWGSGPNKLVMVPGIVSHLEENLRRPAYLYFLESLAKDFHLIIFDKRAMACPTGSMEHRLSTNGARH